MCCCKGDECWKCHHFAAKHHALWGRHISAPMGALRGAERGKALFPCTAFPGRAGSVGSGYQHIHPKQQNLAQGISQGCMWPRECFPPVRGNGVLTETSWGGWYSLQGAPQQQFIDMNMPSTATTALLKGQKTHCEEGKCGDALLHQDTLRQMFKGRERKSELMSLQSCEPWAGSSAEGTSWAAQPPHSN